MGEWACNENKRNSATYLSIYLSIYLSNKALRRFFSVALVSSGCATAAQQQSCIRVERISVDLLALRLQILHASVADRVAGNRHKSKCAFAKSFCGRPCPW